MVVRLVRVVGYDINGALYCTQCAPTRAVPRKASIPVTADQAARSCDEYAGDQCATCYECLSGLAENPRRVNWMVTINV